MSTQLVGARLYWAFQPETFTDSQSAPTWTYAVDSRLNLNFNVPPLKSSPLTLKVSITPLVPGFVIRAINLEDKKGKTVASFNPKVIAREPVDSPVSGACAESEVLNINLQEFCLMIELPSKFARSLAGGGKLVLECKYLPDMTDVFEKPSKSKRKADTSVLLSSNSTTQFNRAIVMRRILELEHETHGLRKAVHDFYSSNSWTMTQPLRELAASVRHFPLLSQLLRRKQKTKLRPPSKLRKLSADLTVDVIIPVYKGFDETLACLDSVLNSPQKTTHQIVVIIDASPDTALILALEDLAKKNPQIILLHNKENLGFTGTVVRGMALNPGHDVVLLNSDTVVSGDWLDRLVMHAHSHPRVGTVTPFSNNASICGYPRFLGEEEIPAGTTCGEIDAIAREVNFGQTVEIPTAVGSCMYITRKCLDDVGEFDAQTFPGYGEENDFSMRALLKSWKHLMAADTFIYHKGAVSFASQSETRKAIALRKLQHLYPQYDSLVHAFIRLDPATMFRNRIDFERLRRSKKPVILAVMHDGTGGTERHVLDLMEALESHAHWFLLKGCHASALLQWRDPGEGLQIGYQWDTEFDRLVQFLNECNLTRVHVHHSHEFIHQAKKLIDALGVPFDFTAHDYSTVCPQVTLTDYSGAYCGEPDEAGCNKCLTFLPINGVESISSWRKDHEWLLRKADRVFAPSVDAKQRLQKYFPDVEILATPHIDCHLESISEIKPLILGPQEKLRIAVIGALSEAKGADLLQLAAIDACARNLPIEFHLIGHAYRGLIGRPKASLIVYGAYQQKDLNEIIGQVNPHLAWFPAVCPETYCYALSSCMEVGLPVVAPDLGAFPERLLDRPWSWVVPWNQEVSQWNDFFMSIRDEHFLTGFPPENLESEVQHRIEKKKFSYHLDYLASVADTKEPSQASVK